MEVLTSKNRMSATMFLSLYFSQNVITRLFYQFNGLAATQHSEDLYILKTVSFGHHHAPWTAFILLLFTLHTFLTHFLDYILPGKNFSSYSPGPVFSTTWDSKGINPDTTTTG